MGRWRCSPTREASEELKRKILSIDGGGIRGILPAVFLAEIEEATGKRISDYFDLVVGTSAGGIVALGIGLGLRPREIVTFFEKYGANIFSQRASPRLLRVALYCPILALAIPPFRAALQVRYDSKPLQHALTEIFGDKTLGDSSVRLVIPSFNRERGEVHIFKTNHAHNLITDYKEKAVDVALATASAPSYFAAHEIRSGLSLIDGGVWANNPAGVGVVEAVGTLNYPRDSIYVLSIGCSESIISIPASGGTLTYAGKILDLFLRGQSRSSLGTAKILTGHTHNDPHVFRIDHVVPEGEAVLDSVQQIPRWRGTGVSLARDYCSQVMDVFLDQPCERFVPNNRERIPNLPPPT